MKTFFLVLLILLALCVLLSFVRLGGRAEYSQGGFQAQVRAGPFYFTVYPARKKKKKAKPKKKQKPTQKAGKKAKAGQKKKEKKAPSLQEKLGGSLSELLDELPAVFALLGEAVRKVRVEELYLNYTIAGRNDPAGAAMLYGNLCATGGVVAGLLGERLQIKRQKTRAWVDFTTDQPKVYVRLTLSYTVGQLVVIGVHVLQELLKVKKIMDNQVQEDKENGKQASDQ